MANKLAYLLLLISLNAGYLLARLFTTLHFLFPRPVHKKDLLIYPYYQEGNIGFTVRFACYLPFLEEEGVRYKMAHLMPDERLLKMQEGSIRTQYFLYHRLFWKRLFQTLEARKYKAVFVQRGLFVSYPDQKIPYLERLLRKLNDNITIDFWDAVWIHNKEVVEDAIKYCDRISVVNEFIRNHFEKEAVEKVVFPIGVNLSKYTQKSNYETGEVVKLFYTGSPYNLSVFLNMLSPALLKLKAAYVFKLVIVSRGRIFPEGLEVEYHDYNETTFYKIMSQCDMGLYAVETNDVGKAKMAMKTLDYMSSALPVIAAPVGLPTGVENGKHLLFASNVQEWELQLSRLFSDLDLRAQLGKEGRKLMEERHNINSSYNLFKQIVQF